MSRNFFQRLFSLRPDPCIMAERAAWNRVHQTPETLGQYGAAIMSGLAHPETRSLTESEISEISADCRRALEGTSPKLVKAWFDTVVPRLPEIVPYLPPKDGADIFAGLLPPQVINSAYYYSTMNDNRLGKLSRSLHKTVQALQERPGNRADNQRDIAIFVNTTIAQPDCAYHLADSAYLMTHACQGVVEANSTFQPPDWRRVVWSNEAAAGIFNALAQHPDEITPDSKAQRQSLAAELAHANLVRLTELANTQTGTGVAALFERNPNDRDSDIIQSLLRSVKQIPVQDPTIKTHYQKVSKLPAYQTAIENPRWSTMLLDCN